LGSIIRDLTHPDFENDRRPNSKEIAKNSYALYYLNMNDPLGGPVESEAQPTPTPAMSPAPNQPVLPSTATPSVTITHLQAKRHRLRNFALRLVVLVVVGGAVFYGGWRLGYNTGLSAGGSPGCINIGGYCRAPLTKPVIYLYPQRSEQVKVQLDYPAGFLSTNPTYNPNSGWQVLASPEGDLTDLSTGKHYSYLFWEGKPAPIDYDMSTGFVVTGSQTETLLRHELPAIGLSPMETNAFISYWIPKMQTNKYNLIHFAGTEYTNYAKLTVTPRPDSMLRVFMVNQPLQQPVAVTPQTFPTFQRKGFTVVEWGGTVLKR
jgi:hypothetical protein